MPIVNREKDLSEQKSEFDFQTTIALNPGGTLVVTPPIPYPFFVESLKVACFGVSQVPSIMPQIVRFIPTAGQTVFFAGTTFLAVNYSTSGALGVSLFSGTATLPVGLAGDMVSILGGASGTIAAITVDVVVRKTQDIVSYYGI